MESPLLSHSTSQSTGSAAAASRIGLQVNGEACELAAGASVAALIEEIGLAGRRLAIAINRDVVPRSRYAERTLLEGDRVEILEAVGGG